MEKCEYVVEKGWKNEDKGKGQVGEKKGKKTR